jgi:hypothetical protein
MIIDLIYFADAEDSSVPSSSASSSTWGSFTATSSARPISSAYQLSTVSSMSTTSRGSKISLRLEECTECSGSVCQLCGNKSYCSIGCQKQREPMHDIVCRQLTEFLATTERPAGNPEIEFKLAAIFTSSPPNLRFVWLECGQGSHPGDEAIPKPQGFLDGSCTYIKLEVDERTGVKLSHHVKIWRGDTFSDNPIATEPEIDELLQGKKKRRWRGPVLITRSSEADLETSRYNDVLPEDIQLVVDYYLAQGGHMESPILTPIENPGTFMNDKELSHGVRICCFGDEILLGKAKLNAVNIPKGGLTVFESPVSEISEHLEFPLRLTKLLAAPHWYSKQYGIKGRDLLFNLKVQKLMICTNPKVGERWAFTEMHEWTSPGPVVVSRADGKPLLTYQISILLSFIDEILTPALMITAEIDEAVEDMGLTQYFKDHNLRHGYDVDVVEKRKYIIRNLMCREAFEKYFEEYKNNKIVEGNLLWANAKSPYDI